MLLRLSSLLVLAVTTARILPAQSADHRAITAVVSGFHQALAAGDSAAAMRFLAPDVKILESGGVESRQQYEEGHLGGDIAFARAVPSTRGELSVTVGGDAAW